MSTIFTKIAKGEIPSYKVAENEDYYAFLDIAPMAKGHTLVIPKNVEDDYIFSLDEATYMRFREEGGNGGKGSSSMQESRCCRTRNGSASHPHSSCAAQC